MCKTEHPLYIGIGVFNDLDMAVLRRMPSGLEGLIAQHSPEHTKPDDGWSISRFETTRLALGWDYGLRRLVAANYPVETAIVEAYLRSDLQSLSILLETPQPIFSEYDDNVFRSIGNALVQDMGHDPACLDLILAEFIRRRHALKDLAINNLSPHQQRKLGLQEHSTLDANAEDTYYCLKQVIDVPASLDCWMSPYLATRSTGQYEAMERKFVADSLHKFYDAGFKSVDIPDDEGETPLFGEVANLRSTYMELGKVPWFLSHGARPERSNLAGDAAQINYPNILFYLACELLKETSRQATDYYDKILKACNESSTMVPPALHVQADGCKCLCGSTGCTATHPLWRCHLQYCSCDQWTSHRRLLRLRAWIRAWRLPNAEKELVYSEVARLEIFERLGMAHTCCGNPPLDGYWFTTLRLCPDEEERMRLQDEDSELALQLQDLVLQYNTARAIHEGTIESFWDLWWEIVDDILPPLLSVEACKNRLLRSWERDPEKLGKLNSETIQNRAAREEDALEKAGYIGAEFEDFREVIRVHFKGRDWNPPQSDDTKSEVCETYSSDTGSCASESEPENLGV
jgi:hypothetical protein